MNDITVEQAIYDDFNVTKEMLDSIENFEEQEEKLTKLELKYDCFNCTHFLLVKYSRHSNLDTDFLNKRLYVECGKKYKPNLNLDCLNFEENKKQEELR